MEVRTTKRHDSLPITEAWNAVKGLDYSDKLELVTMLIESVKSGTAKGKETDAEEYSLRPFTMEELNARIDEAEADIAADRVIDDDDVWDDLEEEIALQETGEREMVEAI